MSAPRYTAHVRAGRLVLDEPATDLAEGTAVELEVRDELAPEERARLEAAIAAGEAQYERGEFVEGTAFIDELGARLEDQNRK